MAAAGVLINVARQGEAGGRCGSPGRVGVPSLPRPGGSGAGPPARPGSRSVSARRGTVIAGGGTGGHIVPSLQIARALVDAGHAADTIELYGSRRGQEATTLAVARVPLHAAARTGAAPEHAPRRPGGPTPGPSLGLVWACARPWARSWPAAPGGRHRRRLRQLPGRAGGGADEGAAGLGEHRRRAGRRQRPAGPLRRGQRRGLRRDRPAPGARHRHAGAARARLAGPDPAGRAAQPGGARPARRPPDRRLPSAARSARGGSTGPWRSWPSLGRVRGDRVALPRHGSAGLRARSRPVAAGGTAGWRGR